MICSGNTNQEHTLLLYKKMFYRKPGAPQGNKKWAKYNILRNFFRN